MNGNSTWQDAVVDSAIAGGAAVVALLSGMTFANVKTDAAGVAFMGILAFLTAFIFTLQAARGRGSGPTHVAPSHGDGG